MWLSIIAYMVRIGAKLGLVQTEPDSAESRAYIRAHDALHWLRNHLVGCSLEAVNQDSVSFWQHGERNQIRQVGNQLMAARLVDPSLAVASPLVFDPKTMQSCELGPEGFAHFDYKEGGLNVSLQAADDSLGVPGYYRTKIRFVVPWRDTT